MFRKTLCFLALIAAAISVSPRESSAVPILQIYVEGATYDAGTETWVFEASSSSPSFNLWVIGNVAGPGGKGTISDVKLAAAYDSDIVGLTIGLVGSTTGGYGGYTDPSNPGNPTYLQTVTDGSAPLLGDGSPLAPHGIYGVGTTWQEFGLGDFAATDSQIADFITSFPVAAGGLDGQINVYQVSVSGLADGQFVHFDAYNHIEAKQGAQYKFAPFSHDGEGGNDEEEAPPVVPEPASMAIWGLGASLALLVARFRRKKAA